MKNNIKKKRLLTPKNDVIFKDMEVHIIEMPKIKKYNKTQEELKRWIEFILNPESEGGKMSIKEDKTLNKAYEKLEEIKKL